MIPSRASATGAAPARPADPVPTDGEYIVIVGGVSLMEWEKFKAQPHDNWWANFVRGARIRTEQIRAASPNVSPHVDGLSPRLCRPLEAGKARPAALHSQASAMPSIARSNSLTRPPS